MAAGPAIGRKDAGDAASARAEAIASAYGPPSASSGSSVSAMRRETSFAVSSSNPPMAVIRPQRRVWAEPSGSVTIARSSCWRPSPSAAICGLRTLRTGLPIASAMADDHGSMRERAAPTSMPEAAGSAGFESGPARSIRPASASPGSSGSMLSLERMTSGRAWSHCAPVTAIGCRAHHEEGTVS